MGMVNINDFKNYNELLKSIYGDNIEQMLLSTADKLSSYIRHTHSMIGFCCGTGSNFSIFGYKSNNIPEDHLQKYIDFYSSVDYNWWYIRQEQLRQDAYVVKGTDVAPPEIIENSIIHQEWEAPLGVFYTVCICIASKGELYGYISIMRPKEYGDYTEEEVNFLENINFHLSKRFHDSYPNGLVFLNNITESNLASRYLLTHREAEIVTLLQMGLSRDEIADQLSISPYTLKKHIANIYSKLGVSNISQLHSILNKKTAASPD